MPPITPDVAENVAALGAAGILAKPFNPMTLADDLARLLGAAAGRSANAPNRLAAVAAEFHRSLPSTAAAIELLWCEMRGRGWHRETAEALLSKAHNLAGTAGLFGHHALGVAAEDAERLLLNTLKLERVPDGTEMQKLSAAIAALMAACRA